VPVDANGNATSTLSAEILKLYADTTVTTAATKQLYISVDTADNSKGKVFLITNGTAANDKAISQLGAIDLADVSWATVTAANFGTVANSGTGGGGGGGGGGSATPVPVSAAGSSNAAAGNLAYTFAAGTYAYNIAGFAAGDKLDFPDAVAASVNNTSFTDGVVELTWGNAGQTITVTLTGIPAATDAQLFGVASFNSVYGTGTVA